LTIVAIIDAIDLTLLTRIGLALALGGLIGIERERHRHEVAVLAGVRTYPLVALTGVLMTLIAERTQQPLFVALGVLFAGGFSFLLFHVRRQMGTTGFTSPIALFVTYLIGVLLGHGLHLEAVVVGLATTVLLFTRDRLHTLAEVMTEAELRGALYVVALAFIVLPLAPNQALDPWGSLNPQRLTLIVLLVSLLSFLAFIALQMWGPTRGLAVGGLLGGLVNSEAATAALSQIVRKRPEQAARAAQAILMATSTMFLRNLAIVILIDPGLRLARLVALPLVAMAIVVAVTARRRPAPEDGPKDGFRLPSPFALKPAIQFALLFAGVTLATNILLDLPGVARFSAAAASLGGLVSAGAVVASMAELVVQTGLAPRFAASVVVVASAISALNKPILAGWGHPSLRRSLWPAALLAPVVGLGTLLLTFVL
jgi:uncharacterized membrane protein (DUF4010 family)